ncbi:flagellar protein FlaG [Virgibacillus oceani]
MRLGNEIQGALAAGQKITAETAALQIRKGMTEDNALQKDNVINKEQVETVVSKLNEFIEPVRTNLKFELHEKLNDYYVTVVDSITNEKIKEIPPKKFLDMYADMIERMGLLIDEKV